MGSSTVAARLERLRVDFASVRGEAFEHFFCPILHVDEDVELCRGHVVAQAFPNSTRTWVVQRKDVDSFYGSNFEADFATILYKEGGTPASVLADKNLSRLFSVVITADGELVQHFLAKGKVPKHFTGLELHDEGDKTALLGLRMAPESAFRGAEQHWEIRLSKDIRIPALVSLIKAGYLTLFSLVGYRYALSSDGLFVGPGLLGRFFHQSVGKPKQAVLNDARAFFAQYVHMVRPVVKAPARLAGTITDRTMFVCKSPNAEPWAVVVFVRTSRQLHGVLLPLAESKGTQELFSSFLCNDLSTISGSFFFFKRDHWLASENILTIPWPKGEGLLE